MKKEVGCQFGLLSGSQEEEKYIELFCASKLYLQNCEKKVLFKMMVVGASKVSQKNSLQIVVCKPYMAMANTFSMV